MSESTVETRELDTDLHGFLCQEAPYLVPHSSTLPSDPTAAEETLVGIAREMLAAHPEIGGHRLYPGSTHGQAAQAYQEELEVLIRGFFSRRRLRETISDRERLEMFRAMVTTRAVDDHLKKSFDRKTVAWKSFPSPQKGFRSTGQEAIAGIALRLRRPPEYAGGAEYSGDVIAPMIRDLGAAMMFLDDPLHVILAQYGKTGTPMGGRDLHIGDLERGVLPPSAPLTIATQTTIGLAYGFQLREEDRVAVSFIGDGGSSLGEWHEAINFAGALRLGVIFVVENNSWALGTHVSEQTAARRFALRGAGYGIPALTVFGNDPEELAAAGEWAARRARAGDGPSLIEVVSYRRSGHAHHDDDRFHGSREPKIPGYELEDEASLWASFDPIDLYERRLEELGVLDPEGSKRIRDEAGQRVGDAAEKAEAMPWPEPSSYRSRVFADTPNARSGQEPRTQAMPERRMAYDEAIRQALSELMAEDEKVFVLGEDVGGRYGGAFGVTRGLAKRFGSERCLNTPLAESAIVGCAVGAALLGFRPVVEIQFADFLAPAFNALVNNAAKIHWRWGRSVPIVVRLPYGGATGTEEFLLGGGPFHSQCPEMWFLRVPGWKIVAPSSPDDAKGLLTAAIRDPNPVLFMECKGLYGFFRTDLKEDVPLGTEYEVELGKARLRREGGDVTVATYGSMVWTCLRAAELLAEEGVSVEVIDLRSLHPLDEEMIVASVRRTHRLVVVHEDSLRGGFGAELTARINELAFYWLDAPVVRVAAPDTPVPYSPPLELDFLPGRTDVVEAIRELIRT